MQRTVYAASRRSYASTTKSVRAQPIRLPRLDSSTGAPPPPAAVQVTSGSQEAGPSRIAVPTTSTTNESQLVTLTLRTKALDIESPALGFDNATFPYVWLRDVCTSPQSVDTSTQQKLFKTTDIDIDVKPRDVKVDEQSHELIIDWDRPLRGKPRNAREKSRYKLEWLRSHADGEAWRRRYRFDDIHDYKTWDNRSITRDFLTIPYEKTSSPEVLQAGLRALFRDGILKFTSVPTEERSQDNCTLLTLASKFGRVLETWYGKAFSVRSYPGSKNIAYTSLPLDLHMDLLHFASPPRYQFLHCVHLDPQLTGGESYFVDAYKAAELLKKQDLSAFNTLGREDISFEYQNDGHWTYAHRPTLEFQKDHPDRLEAVNYSPPFQGPLRLHANGSPKDPTERIRAIHGALSKYADVLHDPKLSFKTQLQPGECMLFDNRRVLHARTGFEAPASTSKGEIRWFMGCYMDETSVMDKYRSIASDEI